MLAACYWQQKHPIFAPLQYSLRAARILRNIAPAASVLRRGCEGSTAAALLLVIAELPLDSTNSVFHEIGFRNVSKATIEEPTNAISNFRRTAKRTGTCIY